MAQKIYAGGVLFLAVSFSAAQTSAPSPSDTFFTDSDEVISAGATTVPGDANSFISPVPAPAPAPSPKPAPVAAVQPEPPAAPLAHQPLSTRDKFDLAMRGTHSLDTFVAFAYEATTAQVAGQWYQYGGGMEGWGKRLGATVADTESRRFIQTFLLSSVLHQDPRYFYSTAKSPIARAWYAASRVLITRKDSRGETFNSSEVLGALFATSLQNAYYPRYDRGWDETMSRFTGGLSSDATSKLLREFTPDLKRIFRKHEPQRIKQFESRLPKSIQQMADF